MMVWITILINILQLLPQLMPIIIEIWDAINGQPIAQHHFGNLLMKYHTMPITATEDAKSAAVAEFQAFHAQYVGSTK